MSEHEAHELFKIVTIEDNYRTTPELLKKYLTDEGLKSIIASKKSPRRTKAIIDSTKPVMMPSKNPKSPIIVRKHPFYKSQKDDLRRSSTDFTKETMSQNR